MHREPPPDFSESGGYDLPVVRAVGRTGAAGELLGEMAEMIVRAVRSSVLFVWPGRPLQPDRSKQAARTPDDDRR